MIGYLLMGAASALAALLWIYSRRASLLKFEGVEKEAEKILEGRLDSLVAAFKKEIPMASAFLTGSLAERLKGRAKEELMQAVPELKERLAAEALASQKGSGLLKKGAVAVGLGAVTAAVLGALFAYFGAV